MRLSEMVSADEKKGKVVEAEVCSLPTAEDIVEAKLATMADDEDIDKITSKEVDFPDAAMALSWLEQMHIWLRMFLDPRFLYSVDFRKHSIKLETDIQAFLSRYDLEEIVVAANKDKEDKK
jgi:hypothetical protein